MAANKTIFTFWEPKENIPAYLELCLDTWKKFLPEYKIVILDYKNLSDYLGENYFDNYLFENFSYPMQSDAIRAAILNKFGGVWMDIDTIITSSCIENILNINSDFILIGNHIAFIKAEANTEILNLWVENIKNNIEKHKEFFKNYNRKNFLYKFFNKKALKFYKRWDYLGNSPLSLSLKNKNTSFYSINRNEGKILPECNWMIENKIKCKTAKFYKEFYFKQNLATYALRDNLGIILLHNSWTPAEFKKMPKEKFLAQNNTLANIFKKIL